ncbi:hypothetical protein D9619_009080 [Psilocybe cf. subviscida]|uniref:Uncharacterized protein n=1 Tax=Psilocybe cf. subviscida TaxID=2480587 RepID=A0A8H5BW79_9AGAR|nr:hypothetical protein D9619_009080 [Psilocybe cf. subviscida]
MLGVRYQVKNEALLGLCFLPTGLGNILGAQIIGCISDRTVIQWQERRQGVWYPEDRLRAALIPALVAPIPLLVYGLVNQLKCASDHARHTSSTSCMLDRPEVPGMPRSGSLARAIRWYWSTLRTWMRLPTVVTWIPGMGRAAHSNARSAESLGANKLVTSLLIHVPSDSLLMIMHHARPQINSGLRSVFMAFGIAATLPMITIFYILLIPSIPPTIARQHQPSTFHSLSSTPPSTTSPRAPDTPHLAPHHTGNENPSVPDDPETARPRPDSPPHHAHRAAAVLNYPAVAENLREGTGRTGERPQASHTSLWGVLLLLVTVDDNKPPRPTPFHRQGIHPADPPPAPLLASSSFRRRNQAQSVVVAARRRRRCERRPGRTSNPNREQTPPTGDPSPHYPSTEAATRAVADVKHSRRFLTPLPPPPPPAELEQTTRTANGHQPQHPARPPHCLRQPQEARPTGLSTVAHFRSRRPPPS